jgi:hypothetical protein
MKEGNEMTCAKCFRVRIRGPPERALVNPANSIQAFRPNQSLEKDTVMAKKKINESWTHIASVHACDRYMHHMPERRGVYYDPEHECLVVFSNNPYSQPHEEKRLEELAELRKQLPLRGWKELGFSYYPPDGEVAHYSYAMVVDAPGSELQALTDIYKSALAQAFGYPVMYSTDPEDIQEFVDRLSQNPPKLADFTKQKPAKAKRASKGK